MKTRSKPAKAMASVKDFATSEPAPKQPFTVPKLLCLPKDLSADARLVILPHSRTQKPTRYYFCPRTGLYEFTQIALPTSTFSSLLVVPLDDGTIASEFESKECAEDPSEKEANEKEEGKQEEEARRRIKGGYVSMSTEVFTVTPIDPLFLVLLAFANDMPTSENNGRGNLLRSAEDLLERLCETSKHFRYIWQHDGTRTLLEKRMASTCDTIEVGEEIMYRLNLEKLLAEILRKAKRMTRNGLPPSMEARFVKEELKAPILLIRREESAQSVSLQGTDEDEMSGKSESQLSGITLITTVSTDTESTLRPTPEPVVVEAPTSSLEAPAEVKDLLRLRTALQYTIQSYIPKPIATSLNEILTSRSPACQIDFAPLEAHLAKLATARAEAVTARSMGDYGRKRSAYEDDEENEIKAEKRRKKDEEEKKKKAGESRAVRDLKKVNTNGMKKMSDFFGKKMGTKVK
ncbi:hypothetical protein MMC25_001151 [Agyrium rufum]|nr:hypothetical protein [Agyrium rufum]